MDQKVTGHFTGSSATSKLVKYDKLHGFLPRGAYLVKNSWLIRVNNDG